MLETSVIVLYKKKVKYEVLGLMHLRFKWNLQLKWVHVSLLTPREEIQILHYFWKQGYSYVYGIENKVTMDAFNPFIVIS